LVVKFYAVAILQIYHWGISIWAILYKKIYCDQIIELLVPKIRQLANCRTSQMLKSTIVCSKTRFTKPRPIHRPIYFWWSYNKTNMYCWFRDDT